MQTAPLFDYLVKTNTTIAKALRQEEGAQDYKHVICQGGGDSAKTVSIIQYLCTASIIEPCIKTLIAADTVPNLKDGAIYTYERYIEPDFKDFIKDYHKTDKLVLFKDGSQIKFKSFENEKTARGALFDYAYFNESNLFDYSLFWQIQRKTKRQTLQDFNPTAEFWAHKQIIQGGELQYKGKWIRFIVDHRHNPFLSEEEHAAYENISDPELFRVYARGQTGKVTGLIFGYWKRAYEMPPCDRYIWGVDYGYTNDETAVVKIGVKGRTRYFQEIAYRPGMTATEIRDTLDKHGRKPHETLYSEIDKEMILQLRKLGVSVQQIKKGPGSKVAGISKLREYECYYIGENFHSEVMNYQYVTAKDLLSGKEILTNEPRDGHDHLCDASRGAVYTDSFIVRAGYE